MVRLKVSAFKNKSFLKFYISIPYGAIKRTDCVFDIKKYLAFQFLMVRLKETPLLKYGITISEFQFLMVRLKAFSN